MPQHNGGWGRADIKRVPGSNDERATPSSRRRVCNDKRATPTCGQGERLIKGTTKRLARTRRKGGPPCGR
eukprot:48874-Prorocentrum_minimum.AAC.2